MVVGEVENLQFLRAQGDNGMHYRNKNIKTVQIQLFEYEFKTSKLTRVEKVKVKTYINIKPGDNPNIKRNSHL